MKTRIAAFLLVAVMLFGVFSISVNAVVPSNPELQSYITSVVNTAGNVIISLPGDTNVSVATTIPSNVTVYVGPGVKLLVYAPLTVNGELRTALSANIITYSGGSVITNNSLPNPSTSYWTQYNPAYPWTINPPEGPYCPTCKTNTRIWCFTCSTYHCVNCTPHYSHPISTVCPTHLVTKIYCPYCFKYYCPLCDGGYHVQSLIDPTKCVIVPSGSGSIAHYCPIHGTAMQYCTKCNQYYCPSCLGGYHYYNGTSCVIIYNGGFSTIPGYYPPYDYYNYIYIPGYGYIAVNIICAAPVANIASGTPVAEGTKVTLTTTTPGAAIYFTTNGSVPTISSTKYTEPIIINNDVTIHAVAISPAAFNSPVSKFIYKIKVPTASTTFKDLKGYPDLASSLDKLLAKKVITAQSTFNPSGTVSWDDVSSWFTALGVKVSSAKIDPKTAFSDSDELTYEEMIFACYKIMRTGKLIPLARNQGSSSIKLLKYSADITNKAMYKAAYASFIENDVLYGFNFKPQDPASRAYLATAVAWACTKVK